MLIETTLAYNAHAQLIACMHVRGLRFNLPDVIHPQFLDTDPSMRDETPWNDQGCDVSSMLPYTLRAGCVGLTLVQMLFVLQAILLSVKKVLRRQVSVCGDSSAVQLSKC
jgi:hypothetical protein